MLITLNVNGKSKGYITDANGQIRISADATLVPDVYSARISFAGNDKYQKSSFTIKMTVKKANPVLSASKKKFKVKSTKKYRVTLKNNRDSPLKKVKITLKVNGKTYTAKTDNNGQALFNLKKLTKKGTYKAVVTYKGNNCYNKVTKTVKITIR